MDFSSIVDIYRYRDPIFWLWTMKWKLIGFAFPWLIAGSDNFFPTERERQFEYFSEEVVS